MVRPQREWTTEEEHSEYPECLHHSQQLFAGGAIVSFSSRVSLTGVCYYSLLATLLLGQYSARGQVRCIHVQDESTLVNGQCENRRSHQSVAQSLEGLLAGPRPEELMALADQVLQGSCERREARDEFPIPGAQTDEGTDLLQIVRHGLTGGRINLGWIHTDASFRHHMA